MTDKVSLHNQRVSFAREEEVPAPPVSRIASLRFVAQFSGGRSVGVDLTGYPIAAIAAASAVILWEETQPGGRLRSPAVVAQITQSLNRFADFLASGYERRTNINALAEVQPADVDAFDDYLHQRFGANSRTAWTRMQAFRQLLDLACSHGYAGDQIKPRLTYVSRHGKGRSTPIDAYSPYVATQIRDAANQDVEEVVKRITVDGAARLAVGSDPDVHGWLEPNNLIWHFANRGLLAARDPRLKPVYNRGVTCGDLIRHVHLGTDEALAFALLLSLSTGLPIECIRYLRTDCLRNETPRFADLCYVKRRRGCDTEAIKRVRSDGASSPGGLIHLLLRLTLRTRALVSDADQKWLFVGYRGGVLGRIVISPGNRPVSAIGRFCAKHAIHGDDGIRLNHLVLQRLRKTYKSERYRKVNGHLADFADDHTVTVASTHYANIPSLRPLHEATIEAGLIAALDAAFRPIVLDQAAEQQMQANPTHFAEELGRDAAGMEAVALGSTDVWLAGCLNFINSPHGEPGIACPSPVWGCLECANAVITASKLPAILCFLDHMLGKRQQLNLHTWNERFGRAYLRITEQILPRFPEQEIANARAIAETNENLVWLPAELTMAS